VIHNPNKSEATNKQRKLNLLPLSLSTVIHPAPSLDNNQVLLAHQDQTIGFQVVKGVIQVTELGNNVIVLSQSWFSWTFALDGLGFKSISTIASFPSLASHNEFKAASIGKTLLHKTLSYIGYQKINKRTLFLSRVTIRFCLNLLSPSIPSNY
jgi:hypothetical protein